MEWYNASEVDVIPKAMNPSNCPQFRPIENYWSIVKGELKKNGGCINDAKKINSKWNKFAGKVTSKLVQSMMGGIKNRVREFLRTNEIKKKMFVSFQVQ